LVLNNVLAAGMLSIAPEILLRVLLILILLLICVLDLSKAVDRMNRCFVK